MIVDARKWAERGSFAGTAPDGLCLRADEEPRSLDCARYIEGWVGELVHESTAPVIVMLEGGHYDPITGSDLFSENSLRCVLAAGGQLIRRYGRRVRIVYGVLVDDIGLDCAGDACRTGAARQRQSGKSLPLELEEILRQDNFVKRERVIISTERHARNRGQRQLKRLRDQHPELLGAAVTIEENGDSVSYLMRAEDGLAIQIAARVGTGWTIKCPLIMASHYSELVDKAAGRFGRECPVAMVDIYEVADRGKVIRGSELALRTLIPAEPQLGRRSILNVTWGDEFGEIFFTDSFHDSDLRPCCLLQNT